MREARAEVLVFLDDDVISVCEFLHAHYQRHAGETGLVVFGGFEFSADAPDFFLGRVTDWSRSHFERCSAKGCKPSHEDSFQDDAYR